MRNWILAAVIGLTVCGQAWARDDDWEDIPWGNGRYKTLSEFHKAKTDEIQRGIDQNYAESQRMQMLQQQTESLEVQKEMLKVEKERLELEQEEALWRRLPRR